MLRRSEFLIGGMTANQEWEGSKRRPVCSGDLLPRRQGTYVTWGESPDEVVLFLRGSKTDWLNQGTVRSHTALPPGHAHSELCVVAAWVRVWQVYPKLLQGQFAKPLAVYRNGSPILAPTLTKLLRATQPNSNGGTRALSLHSLRSGGAAALYQGTGSMDIVKRMGRWRSDAVSAYLWESREQMRGLSAQMASGGHEIHSAAVPHT